MADMFPNAIAYEKLMGRWSERLAPLFLDFAGVRDGGRILDVGCGTGALGDSVARGAGRSSVASGSEECSITTIARLLEVLVRESG